MNWWSETALLWLPKAGQPYPEDFASRAEPGSSDFYYLALDAFDAINRRRSHDGEHEPWAYVLEDQRILSPAEIDGLMGEWRDELRASRVEIMSAHANRARPPAAPHRAESSG